MNKKFMPLAYLLIVFSLLLASCAGAQSTPAPAQVEPAQPLLLPTATDEIAVPQATEPQATVLPTETSIPEVTIQHQSVPSQPIYWQSLPEECNSGFGFQSVNYQVHPPCDAWNVNLIERPVSQDLSQFFHYIDILSAQIGKDQDWYYASMDLFGAGTPEDKIPVTYFFELDLDQNGRGDILISAQNLDLYATEWTVTGVRVWRDMNGDVGGPTAVRPDTQTGDGYETLVFDQGLSNDPDLVWARHDPDNVSRIEFAFKPALLDGKISFIWWAGAMRGDFNPQDFDLVDQYNETELYEIDTTCGWVFGSSKGNNIKKCYVAPNPTPEPRGCIKPPHPNPQDNGWVWDQAACKWILYN